MHDDIEKFSLDGEIADSNIVATKENLVKTLEDNMRDLGYVPCLDLEPQFTLDYRPESENYEFELTVYGIHVGKELSWSTAGMMSGKAIMKSTPKPK